jgi:hypothetical protein
VLSLTDPTKNPVIRTNEKLAGAFDDDAAARGSDAGIDHRDMNGTGRKAFVDGEEIEGRSLNVVRWSFVCNINDDDARTQGEDRSLHRANEIVLRAKVSQESDDWHTSLLVSPELGQPGGLRDSSRWSQTTGKRAIDFIRTLKGC